MDHLTIWIGWILFIFFFFDRIYSIEKSIPLQSRMQCTKDARTVV